MMPSQRNKRFSVKGRPFGSPLARGMKPRASTAAKSTGKPVALASVTVPTQLAQKRRREFQSTGLSLCLVVFLTTGFSGPSATAERGIWQRIGSNIDEPQITHVTVDPRHPATIFVSTAHNIYRSDNQGADFNSILLFLGEERRVNQIYIPSDDSRYIYAATDNSIYKNFDNRSSWETTLTQGSAENKYCLAVLLNQGRLYAGTLQGLMTINSLGLIWQRGKDILGQRAVFLIDQDNEYFYFVTANEVYRESKKTQRLDNIFSVVTREAESETAQNSAEEAIVVPGREISFFKVIPGEQPLIYVITKSGIFYSRDFGQEWKGVAANSLSLEGATSLVALPGEAGKQELFLGTKQGVFLLKNDHWVPLYKGMETSQVNDLAFDGKDFLYAATDRGIFALHVPQALAAATVPAIPFSEYQKIKEKLGNEPSIKAVHRWAIDYAEVHPNKIKGWRMAAAHKAFLPTLAFDLDRDVGDVFHWDSGPNPDDQRKGRDILAWDVSLSWDLGDLIWNDDQTSIDSRSKLMVELRESVLDQVTRLYYERRRLQTELAAAIVEPQLKVDKEMRVEELTALIDGFTGGKFSEEIEKNGLVTDGR